MIAVGIDARGYSVQVLPVGSRDRAGPLLVAHATVTAFHLYISLAQPIKRTLPELMLMMPVEVVGIRRVPPRNIDSSAGDALLERGRHFGAFHRWRVGIGR